MSRPAITPLCDWSDVTARMSALGAGLRTDDDPTSRTDILESGTVEALGYLQLLYEPATLAGSNWVRFKVRDICCLFACIRRNNPVPKSVQLVYDKAIKDLEKCQLGVTLVPDVPQRKANVPVLSNQRAATYPVNRPVNVTGTSTGKREGYIPNDDQTDVIDYST